MAARCPWIAEFVVGAYQAETNRARDGQLVLVDGGGVCFSSRASCGFEISDSTIGIRRLHCRHHTDLAGQWEIHWATA